MDAGKALLAAFCALLLILAVTDARRRLYIPVALAASAFLWAGPLKTAKAACSFAFPLIWKGVYSAWGAADAGLYRAFSLHLWELVFLALAFAGLFPNFAIWLFELTGRLLFGIPAVFRQWRAWDYLFRSQEIRWERERREEEEARREAEGPGEGDWAALGLEPGAPPAEVKAAYRRLVKEHHPDRGGDPEKFKRIHAAYQAVSKGVA